MSGREFSLVYDKECPVCDAYCRRVRIAEGAGELRLINAREDTALMRDITREGLDIDQGMVVKVDGTLHYGADAIHALAQISRPTGVLGHISQWLFATRSRAEIFYPAFRLLRNVLLKVLRKTRINNLQLPNNSRF